MKKYIIAALVTLSLLSCAAKRPATPDITHITYRELLQYNQDWQASIRNLAGQARITLDSPQYSGNFSADILQNGSDSLLITVTGPLGIKLGKVFIASKRFVFYNQVMNQFLTGSKSDFEGHKFFQFPLDITQLRRVFIARDQFNILKKDLYEVRDNQYYLEATNGHSRYKIWFDPALLLVTKLEHYTKEGLDYRKEYSQFKESSGVYFPRAVNFVRPDERQGLSLYFTELQLNQPVNPNDFIIRISDSATQIDLSVQNKPEIQ